MAVMTPAWLTAQTDAAAAKQEGDRLAQTRDFAGAVAAYDRAIQMQPDFAAAYKGRGIAHKRMQQPEAALADFGKAIELDPQDAEAYVERGGAQVALNRLDLAIQDFDKAIALKPDYWQAYSGRGGARSKSGDTAGAKADWDKAESLGAVKRLRVGGNAMAAKLIRRPQPVYPEKAKKKHVEGVVLLNAAVGEDGTITNLSVVSGDPLLVDAALDAVKQWVYAPTLLDGRPVLIDTTIAVTFTLH